MEDNNDIKFNSVELNNLKFKAPEGSRFIVNQRDNEFGEFSIYLPNEYSCIDLKISFVSGESSLNGLLDEKYRVNDEIFHSPLNIAPSFENDEARIICQYYFVDGIEHSLLFRIIGLSMESENVIITFSGLPEDFKKYDDFISEMESSFSSI